jgi:acetylornithine deacetylase/succinyl-diaminopimelate desuccinylase-like protein
LYRYIEDNEENFIKNLRDAVAIQSISSMPEARNESYRMIQFATDKLKALGFETELRKVGTKECNGTEIPHPPAILATKGNDPKKKTLLIYGHLDVQPANKVQGN